MRTHTEMKWAMIFILKNTNKYYLWAQKSICAWGVPELDVF